VTHRGTFPPDRVVGPVWIVYASCLLSCATAELPRVQSEGGKSWRRIESRHLNLVTNMDEGPARAAAVQMELWWEAMAQAMPVNALAMKGNPERLTVLAVRDRWESESISQSIYGFFRGFAAAGPVLYVGDPTDLQGRETVRHELGHAFVHAHLFDVPRWLTEGLAQYLETAEYDETTSRVTWGAVGVPDLANFRDWGRHIAVSNLINSATWTSNESGPYAYQSGLLVHMLINRHGSELDCFLDALSDSQRSAPAFKRCFSSYSQWEREFADYKYSVSLTTKTASATITAPGLRVYPVYDGEVFALLALVDFTIADFVPAQFRQARLDRADLNITRAADADPYHPFVVSASMGMNPEPARCARLTSELIAMHPKSWQAWRLRARTPGLDRKDTNGACADALRTAPPDLEASELYPCIRVPAASTTKDRAKKHDD
jgi:Protein of unknown function (DUF1570)